VELFAKTMPQKFEIGPLGGGTAWTRPQMMQHMLATPIIEVAKGGKTAKGVWMSTGHEARVVGGKLIALWVWGTYGERLHQGSGRVENPQPTCLPEYLHFLRCVLDGLFGGGRRRHLPAGLARGMEAEPAQHLFLDVLALRGDGVGARAA
jgi:hypothetical protein